MHMRCVKVQIKVQVTIKKATQVEVKVWGGGKVLEIETKTQKKVKLKCISKTINGICTRKVKNYTLSTSKNTLSTSQVD